MGLFRKKMFGLEISDDSVRVAELSGKPESAKLDVYGKATLNKGIVENGDILKKKELAQGIANAIEKTSPETVDTEQFIFALPESKVYLHFFEIQNDKEVTEAIREKASRVIPIDLNSAVDDIVPVLEGEKASEYLYVAAERDTISSFVEVFGVVGIEPEVIEFESAAMVRALFETCPDDHASLLVDIGARTSIVSVFDYCNIVFSKNVLIAGNSLTEALSDGLKISTEKAEELKIKYGLSPKTKKGKSATLLKGEIDEVISEIADVVSYYQNKTGRQVKDIVLSGGSSQLKGLPDYLKEKIDISVALGSPYCKLKAQKGRSKALLSPTVIGLALRALEKKPEESGINLLANL